MRVKENLRIHEEYLDRGTKLTCKTCDKQFGRKDTLRTHEEHIHRGTKFTCKRCGNQFNQKGNRKEMKYLFMEEKIVRMYYDSAFTIGVTF